MKPYSAEKLETIGSYIKNPVVNFYNEVFEERYDIVMVVDWRESDEEIINFCENILETGYLSAQFEYSNNKQGFIIKLYYADQALVIPYQGEGADRDMTLLVLNEIFNLTMKFVGVRFQMVVTHSNLFLC